MKVLICGGRNYSDVLALFKQMDRIDREVRQISVVIHGNARGADTIAGRWAVARGKDCKFFPADWSKHGRAAGPIRNQRMIDEGKPDLVVAFPGGRGTADMVGRARAAGIEVIEVET